MPPWRGCEKSVENPLDFALAFVALSARAEALPIREAGYRLERLGRRELMNGLRITLAAGVAAALACTSLSARADEERGLSAGVRVGYGAPIGNAYTGKSLGDLQGGANPWWFDLGYRFNPHFYLGAFYQFAMTYPPNHTCGTSPSGVAQSCDGNYQKFGIDAMYHILPKSLVDPWVGLGIGYEITRINYESNPGNETNYVARGWQYVDIQAGLDLLLSKRIPFGPFVDLSFSQYAYAHTGDQNGNTTDVFIPSTVHEWLTVGLRGMFNF
jgi:hypothetical protein